MPKELGNSDSDDPISVFFSTNVVRYSTHQFKLDRIISDIKVHLYHLPDKSRHPTSSDPEIHQKRIAQDLEAWWNVVAKNELGLVGLDGRQQKIWSYKLKYRFNSAMILLFQPSQSIRNPTEDSLQKCFDCATNLLQTYQALYDHQCIHFGWRTVQNIFAAGATLIYTFWTSQVVQRNLSVINLTRSLRMCSTLLSVGGEWWPSVRIGKKSLEQVFDLTTKKMHTLNLRSKQRRLTQQPDVSVQSHMHLGEIGARPSSQPGHRSYQPSQNTLVSRDPGRTTYDEQSISPMVMGSGAEYTSSRWNAANVNVDNTGFGESQRQWPVGTTDSLEETPLSLDIVPEVENFFAEFNNYEFSWNFPLNTVGYPEDTVDFFGDGLDSE